jgi:hypothetical protein
MNSKKFLEIVKTEGLTQNELNSLVQKEYLRKLNEIEEDKYRGFYNISHSCSSIHRLKELTKVPVEQQEPVQKIYGLLLKTTIQYIKLFRDAVDINPEKETITKTYEQLLHNADEENMHLIRELEEFSGVPLTQEIIQEAYRYHVSKNAIFRLDIIQSATKINPLETIVQERYAKKLSKGYIKDVDALEEKNKILANKEAYISFINYLIGEDKTHNSTNR